MKSKNFSSIESVIKTARKGRMYILVDDENRENEGDLVLFPGWLKHAVAPNKSYEDRISISFNVIKPKECRDL